MGAKEQSDLKGDIIAQYKSVLICLDLPAVLNTVNHENISATLSLLEISGTPL